VAVASPDYDFKAENVVVNLRELTPTQIHFQMLTEVHDRELERGKSSILASVQSSNPIPMIIPYDHED